MADVAEERRVLYVEVRGEENDGLQLEVGPDGLLVGRANTCDVIFQNREVSRRHAYFYSDGQHCHVEDLGSKNGLLVNGRRASKTSLRDGDVVDLGPSQFVIHSDDSDSGARVLALPALPAVPADRAAEAPPAVRMRHPLGVASIVFAVLAYVHWGFGLGAVVLALLSLRETHREAGAAGRGLAWGGLALGLVGGLLNGWFTEGAPKLYEVRAATAVRRCGENLRDVAAALARYRAAHDGAYPARLADLVGAGLLKPNRIVCPAAEGRSAATYAYRPPAPGSQEDQPQVIVWDSRPDNHAGGGWVLWRDGLAQWVGTAALARLSSQSPEPVAAPAHGGPEP